jgi:PAS domain S-box-containing protein
MSIKNIEDKRLEGSDHDHDQLESGRNLNRPDKKQIIGTVQFYEDILHSLNKSFIIVFNKLFKHIEVWGNSNLNDIYGISILDLKGKTITECFPAPACEEFKLQIKEVFNSGKQGFIKINVQFPKGNFWLEVAFSPLIESDKLPSAVIGYFTDITDTYRIEKELISTREKYRNLIELSPEGILTANLKGVITSVNHSLLRITGCKENTLLGKKITRLPQLKVQDIPRFQEIIDNICESRITPSFEIEWSNNEGQPLWCEIRSGFNHRNNKIIGFQLIFNDITERKSIEHDLLKSKQAYKVIIENAPEAIYITQKNHIIFCNSRLLEMVNCSMDEVLRVPFQNFIHPDDVPVVEKKKSEYMLGRSSREKYDFRIVDSKGILRWIRNNTVTIDWDGSPALLSFATDITEKKSANDIEKEHLAGLEFLSEKILEFVELKSGYNLYRFLGEKIAEIQRDSLTLLISYNSISGYSELEHIEGPGELREVLLEIINNNPHQVNLKLNNNLIRNLSYGKLIKLNDGLFEQGSTIFPKNTFALIRQKLNIGGIYLIGLSWENNIFGNAIIFLPENEKLENQEAIETIVKLCSFALRRNKVEDDLKNSEEKFRRIFESYQDVYYRSEIDGIITEVSPSIFKIMGYHHNDIPGRDLGEFFVNQTLMKNLGKTLLKEGFISDQDIQLICKDGNTIDASLNARILKDAKGTPAGSEGVIRDISERKKADSDFHKTEEKFRMLADFTYDWEYWIAPDNTIIHISPSCERISGYRPRDFISNPGLLEKIIHPDDRHLFNYNFPKHSDPDNNVIKFDFRIVTKDKQIKWINHVCRKVYGHDDKYLGLRASNRDITDRKEAEQALRESEERFRTLFYKSPDAVFVEDYDGNILDANPAACKLHQVDKMELIGKNVIELIPNYQKDEVAQDFSKWITGEYKQCRGVSKSATGLCIPVEIHASKINYSGKNALMFIVRDITVIKETEDKLREAKEKAEEADMLKSVFLANMSHEIRTPMNAIIGFSEILSDQDLTKKERTEFINYITQGSNTLMNLIEDIIDITKIEAGQIKINFAECDVNTLMDELYATFLKIKNKNDKKKIELRLIKPVVEPGFTISTDPGRIRQILSNLIGNALKFTEEGFIEIGFTNPGDNQIVFYVKDTGIGIPKDKQEIIFERFGQVEDPSGKERNGTGLGLSISRKLAELLGGILAVESEIGKGSLFSLTLPLKKDHKKLTGKEKTASYELSDWSTKTFLIAEDSILNYTYLEALFQKTKVNILWAKDGREAIDLCRDNEHIDLVLMDIKMPVLNGLEAIAEIKKFRKQLPIIVQTAYAMPEDREKSFAAGGDDHLTKPINADELFASINKFLN